MAEPFEPVPDDAAPLSIPRHGRIGHDRRIGLRRACLVGFAFCASVLCLGIIAGGFLFLRLTKGPIDVGLGGRIAAALETRVTGYTFAIGSTVVERSDSGPRLTVSRFSMADRAGRVVLAAPHAGVSVDPVALVFGTVSPKRLEIEDIVVHVVRQADGQVAMTAGGAEGVSDISLNNAFASASPAAPDGAASPAPPQTGPVPAPGPVVTRALVSVVNGLVDAFTEADSPFRALDRFGIARGMLVVDDRLRGAATTYRNFAVDFDRDPDGVVFVTAGADGPAGHWSVSARIGKAPDGSRIARLTADHLSMDELMLAGGLRRIGVDTDMPLSANLDVGVSPTGRLASADGYLSFAAGYFHLDDPDHEPAMVDAIRAPVHVDPASGALALHGGELRAGDTVFRFDLDAAPPAAAGDPWRILGRADGVFGTERPGEKPIPLNDVGFDMAVLPSASRFDVKDFHVNGPDVAFKTDAVWQGHADGGFLITSSMTVGRVPGATLLRLWPNWVATPPRAWLLANMRGGTLEYGRGRFALTDADLDLMRNQHSVPDDHSRIDFAVSNLAISFMDGLPPLKGIDGTGVITGDTVTFTAGKGELEVAPGRVLAMSEGSFTVPSSDPKPTPATVAMRMTGRIDAVADLLSRDALKPYANLPIDASAVRGDVDGRLTVNLLLGGHDPANETKVGVAAAVKNFSADKVIGKEPLAGADMSIVADRNGLHAKGDGSMYGAPATVDLRKPAGGAPSEAVVTVTLDDAARAKAGMTFGRTLTGPVSARITTSFSSGEKSRAAVDVDFTRAAFDAPLPGLKKNAGRPAKAALTVVQGANQILLEQIAFDSGTAAIRGSAELDGSGTFRGAKLSQLRLSPGDDMKVEAEQAADGLRLTVRGTNIDARPFLKAFGTGDAGSDATPGKDLNLDLHTNLLSGQNGQVLANADLRLSRKAGQIRRVQLTGRLGRGSVTVNTVAQGADAPVVIQAKDAGAALLFLDLYKRMDGGRLDATLRVADARLDGTATIHDFTIKEDPAIKKLAEEEIPSDSRNAKARITSSAVPFSKLEASFSRVGNKVTVREGSMFGPQVGATVEGAIDFARDRVDLSGTFVPVYGLNNLFSQIPVVGVILGGGQHEGLFAVNYRIDGSASAPIFHFDPLSALAPGIFRKIFGAIDSAAQGGGGAQDTTRDRATGPGDAEATGTTPE